MRGRTWERQAYIKARPVAGDLALGGEFLAQMAPWIYRRYLSRADISGIKALKRRIEQQNRDGGGDDRNVKTGHGGIRDVEFVIQFLQLLNGGDLPELRTANTLEAMAQLEHVGCLTDQERALLEENYTLPPPASSTCLQIMFDLQTHLLPKDDEELRKLAVRMGYADAAAAAGAGGLLGRLPRQDRAEPQDARPPAARRLQRRRRDRGRVGPGAGSRSAAGADRRGAGQVSASAT